MQNGWKASFIAATMIMIGCNPGTVVPESDRNGVEPASVGSGFGGPHVMPVSRPEPSGFSALKNQAGPPGAQLQYFGGPVLQNVRVVTLFWNKQVQFQSQLNSFYGAVINSAYFDWLNEYNTASPAQKIGRGTFGGSVTDPSPPASTSLTDAQIQTEIAKLLDNKTLPANNANTLYAVHFPPGVSITMADGSGSCSVFCAYHSTFVHGGANVYYSIVPDQGGSCAGGCGGAPSLFNNTTSVASHELVEATTDPAVGLATSVAAPIAWYDPTNGEIGDICNAQQGTAAGFTVQLEWSNKANNCIDHAGTCTPQCGGKQCGSDGCNGSCGTCPSGQSCDANGQCQKICTPQCNGKTCGPDGCGGTCGTCPAGQTCDSTGKCQTICTPNCNGKTCGPDGCGGTCGSCPAGQTCGSNGQCTPSGGTCGHPICSTGGALSAGCDPCATKICAADSFCCSTQWDSICVGEVTSICGQSCGGNGHCAHALCATGSKLAKKCDPCVTKICAADSFCCSTSWDSVCVGEVTSLCGQACQ
jgi:hypothetical protein